jgi:hypothetical protein
VEEKQRGLGIIPNFYAIYAPNPAPLAPRLKFSLAFRVLRDPFTIGGTVAATGRAPEKPFCGDGWKGFGERFGANYANQFTYVMIGGAILPSCVRIPATTIKARVASYTRSQRFLSPKATTGAGSRTTPALPAIWRLLRFQTPTMLRRIGAWGLHSKTSASTQRYIWARASSRSLYFTLRTEADCASGGPSTYLLSCRAMEVVVYRSGTCLWSEPLYAAAS